MGQGHVLQVETLGQEVGGGAVTADPRGRARCEMTTGQPLVGTGPPLPSGSSLMLCPGE